MSCAMSLSPLAVPVARSELHATYRVHPLEDPRWDRLVQWHPRASVFHSPAWLKALSQTYGYSPVAYTTSAPGTDLRTGLLFCSVESWLTGRRLVSLPFSDHCEPLVDSESDLQLLATAALQEARKEKCKYVGLRPLRHVDIVTSCPRTTVAYTFHQLDLSPDLTTLFSNLHKSSTQRKIRRAEREGLMYQEGSTLPLFESFYRLFQMTRGRHNLPSQPREWFINLMSCCGDTLKIRVARKKDGQAVAAMITLRFNDTLVYKYGCSDSRFNNLGSMHLLFWRSIMEAKNAGLRSLDFGRTNADQQGLITFKNRWGAKQSTLTYSRYAVSGEPTHWFDLPSSGWRSRTAKQLLALLPLSALNSLGDFLYKHVG